MFELNPIYHQPSGFCDFTKMEDDILTITFYKYNFESNMKLNFFSNLMDYISTITFYKYNFESNIKLNFEKKFKNIYSASKPL